MREEGSERGDAGDSRLEMECLEAVVGRKKCGEAVETLSRAPEVGESEGGEVFPTSTQVEVIRDRTSETGTTGASIRYVEILLQGQILKHS